MKKVFLGLLVAAIAVGGSAFTNAKKGVTVQDHLIQSSLGVFEQLPGTPNPNSCTSTSTRSCIYNVKPEFKSNIPDQLTYSTTEIDSYVSNGWIVADPSSSLALYQ